MQQGEELEDRRTVTEYAYLIAHFALLHTELLELKYVYILYVYIVHILYIYIHVHILYTYVYTYMQVTMSIWYCGHLLTLHFPCELVGSHSHHQFLLGVFQQG